MPMETRIMGPRDLAFLLSEANGQRSRNSAVIAAGAGLLDAGTVLGKVTDSGEYAASGAAEAAGFEGAETAKAILAYGVDASVNAAQAVVIDRDAEVKAPMLIFDPSVDDNAKRAVKITQLAAVGLRVR